MVEDKRQHSSSWIPKEDLETVSMVCDNCNHNEHCGCITDDGYWCPAILKWFDTWKENTFLKSMFYIDEQGNISMHYLQIANKEDDDRLRKILGENNADG